MSEINWDTPEIANNYDQNSDHQFEKGQMLVGMMKIAAGDDVLDIGCGPGRQAEHISHIIGGSGHLMGIDPSSHRIAIARDRFKRVPERNVIFQVGQAEYLTGLQNNSFDHALFCSSFHWVDDKPAALAEVYRVLKPGGTIGMTTLNREGRFLVHDIMNQVLTRYGLQESEMHGHEGMKRVTREELIHLLKGASFQSVEVELRDISSYHNSPQEYLDKKGAGSFHDITRNLDESLQKEIRGVFHMEVERQRAEKSSGKGTGTLFALAKKILP